ncbi:MAG: hypothetical protein DMF44_01320 [Verrucomicrobia bacterium]|nr:MAG: hypothetical protein DMF44_01320 [Verrucomicrobiota bacterium]
MEYSARRDSATIFLFRIGLRCGNRAGDGGAHEDVSGSSSSSSENFVAEKDGKFVITVPGPCK